MTGDSGFSIGSFVDSYLQDLKSAIDSITTQDIEGLVSRVMHSRSCGASIHFIGNGGSAATPSHSAGDWSKELGLKTISHVDNAASLTAWANDTDYENVFVGQLKTFAALGDLVVGFSGAGYSKIVLNGLKLATEIGCDTVAVTGDYMGRGGGQVVEIADVSIIVPSESMERIEDLQLVINHILKEAIKANNGL